MAGRDVVDSTGALLDFDGLREIQSNGAGEDGWDDQLLDPDTLEVLVHAPLYEDDESSAAVDLPDGGAATLTLSWPTSHGYSALLADIPGPGRYRRVVLFATSGDLADWREALAGALPRTWLPRQLVVTPIPRTSGGKPDREALNRLVADG